MKFDPHEKKHPAIDNTVVHCNCFQCVSSGFIREVLPGSNTYMLYIKLSIPCLKFTKQTPQTYRYLLYGVGDEDVYPLQKWVESGNRLHLLFEKQPVFQSVPSLPSPSLCKTKKIYSNQTIRVLLWIDQSSRLLTLYSKVLFENNIK